MSRIGADELVKHFAWNGLNGRFKTRLVQITNNTPPSLKDIMDNYFVACERYETQEKPDPSRMNIRAREANSSLGAIKEKTSNLAIRAKVDTFKGSCYFCAKAGVTVNDHRNYNCIKFSTPSAKIVFEFNECLP